MELHLIVDPLDTSDGDAHCRNGYLDSAAKLLPEQCHEGVSCLL